MKAGTLDITKTTSNHGPDVVTVRVTDAESRRRVIEFEVSMEEWAQACFSLGARPCTFRTWPEREPRRSSEPIAR